MIDLKALKLELDIAAAARHLYECECNLEPGEPELVKAHQYLELAIQAADMHENPFPLECHLESDVDEAALDAFSP